ncbi:MAG: preprotein translocase subunit YajC [Propionibacteriaceae bacterium]|nr:preprotein translocase subunit YajC [Propionibacteriaceae bacterium]
MGIELVLILVVMGVAMYFLMIRPAKKQQQKQQAMMNALEVGTRVMLGSGIYGTIRHLGDKQAVIEISPGVDLTILRAAIRGAVTPDEEEFEYSTDSGEAAPEHLEDMGAYEADLASPFAPTPDETTQDVADDQESTDSDASPESAGDDSEKTDEK